ncbi:MAG TPA: sigma-70 family RNA polymerase sigma factor [Steroidobacteraceae bacterium]|nr:sigma-70 family RNA polymerase sigma factor [Steroidobacteraceae bacterium]
MPQDSHAELSGDVAGDGHAQRISRLFSEHNESLIQFLATRLRSVQEAKEVAQEAYVRLLSLEDSGAVSFLRAFLFKTAANLAVDRIRSRNRQRQALDAGLCDESREAPTPDREAATAQEMEIVRRLIGELPPKCRRAFLLHRVQGAEFSEIAKEMGLSERMVRHYVLRAVLYCRTGLDAAQSCQESGRG